MPINVIMILVKNNYIFDRTTISFTPKKIFLMGYKILKQQHLKDSLWWAVEETQFESWR